MSARPEWERWLKSLRHTEVKTIGDAVEQLMYEAIEFGGDMGPNGNTYNGIDEGDVLTSGYINGWVKRFENMQRPGTGRIKEDETGYLVCSECGAPQPEEWTVYYCWSCGAKVVEVPCETSKAMRRLITHCKAAGWNERYGRAKVVEE